MEAHRKYSANQALFDKIHDMRLTEIETLREIEEELLQAAGQACSRLHGVINNEDLDHFYQIVRNFRKFKTKTQSILEALDSLENELKKH